MPAIKGDHLAVRGEEPYSAFFIARGIHYVNEMFRAPFSLPAGVDAVTQGMARNRLSIIIGCMTSRVKNAETFPIAFGADAVGFTRFRELVQDLSGNPVPGTEDEQVIGLFDLPDIDSVEVERIGKFQRVGYVVFFKDAGKVAGKTVSDNQNVRLFRHERFLQLIDAVRVLGITVGQRIVGRDGKLRDIPHDTGVPVYQKRDDRRHEQKAEEDSLAPLRPEPDRLEGFIGNEGYQPRGRKI